VADGTDPRSLAGPILLVLLVALSGLSLLPTTGAAESPGEDAPRLHLRGDHPGGGTYRNFTSQPAENATPIDVEPCNVTQQGQATWCWQIHRSPRPWTLKAGAPAEALLHLGNLQRVPLGTPSIDSPTAPLDLRLDIVITKGSQTEAARGTHYIQAPVESGKNEMEIRVPLHVDEDIQWNTTPGDAPAVELQIHLSGLIRRDEPPTITTGTPGASSWIHLPGFPHDAFQEWEQSEQEARECQELILAQQSCALTDEGDTAPGLQATVQEAPAFVAPAIWGALVGTLFILQRARRTSH
jgi:hypothetical protein